MNEQLSLNQKVEIKPIGSYFQVDENGYLVNPNSPDKIQAEWKPAIQDTIELYKAQFGDKLKNVYLRGSVAKGDAIKDVSDLDTFSYVDLQKEEIPKQWGEEDRKSIENRYPFVKGIELKARSLSQVETDANLLVKSLCVYGSPFEEVRVKPGKGLMKHIYKLEEKTKGVLEKIQTSTAQEAKIYCDFLMKEILRSGFDITMERSGRYTRDLYLCYKDFSEYYPDKEPQMREVLNYALNPTDNKEKIKELSDSITPWLIEESKKFS